MELAQQNICWRSLVTEVIHLRDLQPECLFVCLLGRYDIHDEIKRRLNSGDACYHSDQNFFSSRLISKNLKIKIYKSVILLVVLYGCETWSPTFKEEHRLRAFENSVDVIWP
jgi:hypothetical protein